MRLEKRRTSRFCGISLQFRPKLFQMARTPFQEFTKKFFPTTQNNPFWKDIGARNGPERSFYFLSLALILLISFLFLLTISRPPRGMSEIKKSFTLYPTLVA